MSDNKIGRNNLGAGRINTSSGNDTTYSTKPVTVKTATKKSHEPINYSAVSISGQAYRSGSTALPTSSSSLDDIAEAVANKLIEQGNIIPSGLQPPQSHNDFQKGIVKQLQVRKNDLPFMPRALNS
jgi:hypothetical protein